MRDPGTIDSLKWPPCNDFMFILYPQTVQQITEADMDPCFVQVALLQKGDVFVSILTVKDYLPFSFNSTQF